MTAEFERAKDLFDWNRRIFAIIGVWPLQSSYVKFTIWILYFLIHVTTLCADLFSVFGNLELMVFNLSESMWDVMILSKLLIMRFSRTLATITKRIVDSTRNYDFDSIDEMNIYLKYNRIAKTFFKIWLTIGVSSSIIYNLKPLTYRVRAGSCSKPAEFSQILWRQILKGQSFLGLWNESLPFVLTYRARFFFEVNDSMTFWLVWIYQTPIMFFNISHTVTIGYVFSLILHISGRLSVLAFRIRNLGLDSPNNGETSENVLRDIVSRHWAMIGMVDDINKVFGLLLLEEVLIMTVLLGLTSYSVIVNLNLEDVGELFGFLFYACGLFFMIYGYCLAGEYLIDESTNLYAAYYQCQWYCMSPFFKKQLVICMIGTSKPVHLTAGGFYHFSLEGFTSILKTSAGYISLLRTII